MAETSQNPKLSCRNIWKVYGAAGPLGPGSQSSADDRAEALRRDGKIVACCDVSFDVHEGEIFVIMGLSGSGKSTVIRCLSRLVEPTSGEILFDGRDVLSMSEAELIELRRHKMGMVFQNFGLLPHLSVLDNIAFPLKLQGMDYEQRRARAREVVDLVGLAGREDSFPRELSGGQQQRVGIARSLTVEPELWFLDEPFSALDPLIRKQMQDEFLRLQSTLKKTIVFITHDFAEALRIADRMAIMRDGQIVQIGTPEDLVMNPANEYVANFTSEVPLIRVLRAHQVARPLSKPEADMAHGLPHCPPDTPVEHLLGQLAKSAEGVVLRDGSNPVSGIVTAKDLVTALSREGA